MKLQNIDSLRPEVKAILDALEKRLDVYCSKSKNPSFTSVYKDVCIQPVKLSTLVPLHLDQIFPGEDALLISMQEDRNSTPIGSKVLSSNIFFHDSANVEDSTLDISGQPLECPFNLMELRKTIRTDSDNSSLNSGDNKPMENEFKPTSLSYGRLIINSLSSIILDLYSKSPSINYKIPPILAIIDAKDNFKSCLLGCHLDRETNTSSTSVKADLIEGVLKKGIPTLAQFKSPENFHNPMAKVSESIYCVYNFSNESSNLLVECNWKKATEMLCPPTKAAEAKLKVKIVLGENSGALTPLYKQLCLLRNAAEALKTGEMVWHQQGETNLIQKIKDLIQDTCDAQVREKETQDSKSMVPDSEEDRDFFFQAMFISERVQGDFTAKLWNVFQNCQSLKELQEALTLICNSVSSGEIIPQLNRSNTTQLGKWIVQTEQADSVAPLDLSRTNILKLLIEIGIDKLWNDYCAGFLGLMTLDFLKEHFTPISEGFHNSVSSLLKIHYSLELVYLCQRLLQIEIFHLNGLIKRVLKDVPVENFLEEKEITLPIAIGSILPILNKMHPEEWEIHCKVEDEGKLCIHRSCQLSQTRPNMFQAHEKSNISDSIRPEDTKINAVSNVHYYGIIVRAVTHLAISNQA